MSIYYCSCRSERTEIKISVIFYHRIRNFMSYRFFNFSNVIYFSINSNDVGKESPLGWLIV